MKQRWKLQPREKIQEEASLYPIGTKPWKCTRKLRQGEKLACVLASLLCSLYPVPTYAVMSMSTCECAT